MQGPLLAQKQHLRAIPVQIQANAILNMSLVELQQFIEAEAMENPALAVKDGARCPVCGFLTSETPCPVCGVATRPVDTLTENVGARERDYLEAAFASANQETFDPFRTIASAIDLLDHLRQQARMCLAGRALRIAEYLIDSLDDDGYFRESLYETAERFAAAVPEIESVLATLQSFDPPGIASRDLRESLLIQLRYLPRDESYEAAERMLSEHWNDFCKMKLKSISAKMNAPLGVVKEAYEFIRDNLNPYPASGYRQPYDKLAPREVAAVVPDIMVHGDDDSFRVSVVDCLGRIVSVDETYDSIYESMKSDGAAISEDEQKHVKEHVERVKLILEAIQLRKKTLAKVALALIEHQREFLLHGPSHLKPLKQKDLARALGVHESTICRAVANKHCRLPSGEVVSFELFFDSALPVRDMISKIVSISTEPLSDSEIAKRLAEQGISIARRTVAKYRDQLKLPAYQMRAV